MGPGKWGAFAAALLALACAIVIRAADPAIFSATRGAGFDTLQQLWPRHMAEAAPVRIVDIDEQSLKALGQWPWPRTELAKMVNELADLGAAVVAFDIVFPEADRLSPRKVFSQSGITGGATSGFDPNSLPDNDAIFADAIRGKPVVLAFAASGEGDPSQLATKAGFAQTGADASAAPLKLQGLTANIDALNAAATGLGSITLNLAQNQGIARQVPLLLTTGERLVPGLAIEALRVAQGAETFLVNAAPDTANAIESIVVGDLEVPVAENGMFQLYFRANDPTLYVSAADLIGGQKREELRPLIEGHLIFIGTSAVGLLDIRTTTLGESVPGVSVHAQLAEQILTATYLQRPEWLVGTEYLFVVLSGLLLALLGAAIKPWKTILVFGALAIITVATTGLGFRLAGLLMDATFPLAALASTFLISIAFRLLVTDRESRKLRGAFGQYVAPDVLAEIEANPKALKLGGEMRDVTVMFVDIVNFTPLGEKLPPETLVRVVNRLLDACSKAILAERGTIDKYIGDAVMAFWNAPVTLPDHQYRAAKAALGIRRAVAALNEDVDLAETLKTHDCPRLAVRVGLASGQACVGNMGSETRFDYSVLGETVNVASRAEGKAKDIGHDIIIAGALAAATEKLALISAGAVAMKGKTKSQPVAALVGDENTAEGQSFKSLKIALQSLTASLQNHADVRSSLAEKSLLDELASQHPEMANYIAALPGRINDFKNP